MHANTYHSVPSTSKMMPFSFGRSCPCRAVGSNGANRLGSRFVSCDGAVDMARQVGLCVGPENKLKVCSWRPQLLDVLECKCIFRLGVHWTGRDTTRVCKCERGLRIDALCQTRSFSEPRMLALLIFMVLISRVHSEPAQ